MTKRENRSVVPRIGGQGGVEGDKAMARKGNTKESCVDGTALCM